MVEEVNRRGGMCLSWFCDAREEKWWWMARLVMHLEGTTNGVWLLRGMLEGGCPSV